MHIMWDILYSQDEERGTQMSEKEKKILESIAKALSDMPEFDKGYLLGRAEAMATGKRKSKENSQKRKRGEETAGEKVSVEEERAG